MARARYHTRRQRLQKVNTKNAKRRLRKNAGRERRFQKDVNHCISKALVRKAAVSCKAIALEDLSGIRERVTVRHEHRYERHSWAFYQLRQFLTYKAAWAACRCTGRPSEHQPDLLPCGHCEKANRKCQEAFLCQRCGFALNADHNAAINICRKEPYRAAVNRPMASPSRVSCKPPALAVGLLTVSHRIPLP